MEPIGLGRWKWIFKGGEWMAVLIGRPIGGDRKMESDLFKQVLV